MGKFGGPTQRADNDKWNPRMVVKVQGSGLPFLRSSGDLTQYSKFSVQAPRAYYSATTKALAAFHLSHGLRHLPSPPHLPPWRACGLSAHFSWPSDHVMRTLSFVA